jgi:predicted dehydrogenase
MKIDTLIVGFGRAGRDLHLKCLKKLHLVGPDIPKVHVVETNPAPDFEYQREVQLYQSLDAAAARLSRETIVHVCTPPTSHAKVVEEAARLGFRRFIIEKPLADSYVDACRLAALNDEKGLDILVVGNWTASRLVETLKTGIGARESSLTPIGTISMSQSKSRVSRTIVNEGHRSAFDVEMPHLVALALHLAGLDAALIDAGTDELKVGPQTYPSMGAAFMELGHVGSWRTRLFTNLASPVRARYLEYQTEQGSIRGYFPADGSDEYSYLLKFDSRGLLLDRALIEDDPLSSFLAQSYHYFGTGKDRPISNLAFNLKVIELLDDARALSAMKKIECESGREALCLGI